MKSCQQQEISLIKAMHRYVKYLIVGFSLFKSNCMIPWEMKQQP